MSMDLLSAVGVKRSISRAEVFKRYSEILHGGDPALADELNQLAEKLGKSMTDIQADVKLIEHEKFLTRAIEDDGDAFNDSQAATKQTQDYRDETSRIVAEREAEEKRLTQLEFDATQKMRRQGNNRLALAKLRKENELFKHLS